MVGDPFVSRQKEKEKEKPEKYICIHPRVIDKPHSALGLVVCLDCGLMFWPEMVPPRSYRNYPLSLEKKETEVIFK